MGSTWKNRISLSIFGQSHGAAIGMTLDGIPAGERVNFDELHKFLKRRAPGQFPWTTPRKEEDMPEVLSGIVDGVTCGAPITAIIKNTNTQSGDYSDLLDCPRPGHADYTALVKYGKHADFAGGGHFSGRLTAALCIAGGICLQILKRRGITIAAHIASVGNARDDLFDPVTVNEKIFAKLREIPLPVLNPQTEGQIISEIENAKNAQDSIGGIIECAAVGTPAGLGSPMFFGMENRISQLVFAVPAVRGIEFGTGFAAAEMRGSKHNDPFITTLDDQIKTATNNHGGILGGITTGMPIIFRTAIKPTPSIAQPQQTLNIDTGEQQTLTIKGRHDPCIVPRAVPCTEAALAIAIYDALIENI